ncbi:anti-sigma factor antagonist [Streptomyces sp. LN704]|uniref:anti-sigma factor antagonist n=1 Tax=unclassified Streptomyces TaxID=2593676 RepID=UPI00371ED3F8
MDTSPAASDELVAITTRYEVPRAFVMLLRGCADLTSSGKLEEIFGEAAGSGCPVIVDLAGLAFGDEHLLGHLLAAREKGELMLVGPLSRQFHQRMDVTGTVECFDVQPDLTTALAHLPG